MLGLLNFDRVFPEIARDETRCLLVSATSSEAELPSDTYQLREFYCIEPGCDCRRVILHVIGLEAGGGEVLASIAYGFDRTGKFPGPDLDPANPQSEHSETLLDLVKDTALSDTSYVARLERHYRMMKEVAENPGHSRHDRLPEDRPSWGSDELDDPEPLVREQPKVGRNETCPCGSGKKYKKCCLQRDEAAELARAQAELSARLRAAGAFRPDDRDDEDEQAEDPLSTEGMSPYAALKHIEEYGTLPADRTAPSSVAALGVEEIQARLGSTGVDASREAFLRLAEGRYSAWSLSEEWEKQASSPSTQARRDFFGLAACKLWKSFRAETPSIEMLDDWIDEGYALDESHQNAAACDRWLDVWRIIRSRLTPEMRTAEQASSVFQGADSLENWVVSLSEELYARAFDDPEVAAKAAEFVEQLLLAFPGESEILRVHLGGDLGEMLFLAGKPEEGTRALLSLIHDFPRTAVGYVRLADCLERDGKVNEARAVLEEGARAGMTDGDDFDFAIRCEEMGVSRIEREASR